MGRKRGKTTGVVRPEYKYEHSAGIWLIISFCLQLTGFAFTTCYDRTTLFLASFSLASTLMSRSYNNNTVNSNNNAVLANPHNENININNMDRWRVAVLGDGGVGKTALAVQVSRLAPSSLPNSLTPASVHSELFRWYVKPLCLSEQVLIVCLPLFPLFRGNTSTI